MNFRYCTCNKKSHHPKQYTTTLCTIDLCCAPPTCIGGGDTSWFPDISLLFEKVHSTSTFEKWSASDTWNRWLSWIENRENKLIMLFMSSLRPCTMPSQHVWPEYKLIKGFRQTTFPGVHVTQSSSLTLFLTEKIHGFCRMMPKSITCTSWLQLLKSVDSDMIDRSQITTIHEHVEERKDMRIFLSFPDRDCKIDWQERSHCRTKGNKQSMSGNWKQPCNTV